MGLAYSTVRNIVLKFQETGSIKNKPRCGGPQKLKAEDIEMLKHDVLEDRESRTMPLFDITMKLNSMLTTDVSQTTVRCTLKKKGIKCHAAVVKPFVSETNAAKRVAWCKERLNWKIKDWEKVCICFALLFALLFTLLFALLFALLFLCYLLCFAVCFAVCFAICFAVCFAVYFAVCSAVCFASVFALHLFLYLSKYLTQ
jgi:transposase